MPASTFRDERECGALVSSRTPYLKNSLLSGSATVVMLLNNLGLSQGLPPIIRYLGPAYFATVLRNPLVLAGAATLPVRIAL